jgi:hypothetical protein
VKLLIVGTVRNVEKTVREEIARMHSLFENLANHIST